MEKENVPTENRPLRCSARGTGFHSFGPGSDEPCSSGGFSGGVCNRFDETHLTNKYQFGDNFIKFTVENLINPLT